MVGIDGIGVKKYFCVEQLPGEQQIVIERLDAE